MFRSKLYELNKSYTKITLQMYVVLQIFYCGTGVVPYMRKTSCVAVMAFLAKKNWRHSFFSCMVGWMGWKRDKFSHVLLLSLFFTEHPV